jgi:hypothetical protein
MSAVAKMPSPAGDHQLEKKPVKFSNLLLGAGLNMFEVTTLGQPLEVVKTTMAANRGESFATAIGRIWSRGGVLGCELLLDAKICLPIWELFTDMLFLMPQSTRA